MAEVTRNLIHGSVLSGAGTCLYPVDGPRPNEVWFGHVCPVIQRWHYSQLPYHTLTGSLADGTLTIRASILCQDCNKHGWITNNTWSEA